RLVRLDTNGALTEAIALYGPFAFFTLFGLSRATMPRMDRYRPPSRRRSDGDFSAGRSHRPGGPDDRRRSGPVRTGQAVAFGAGDYLTVTAEGSQEGRSPQLDAIIVGGRPIREPLAWAGPFVMNNKAEVLQAYEDFQRGRFGHIPA
ncbi:MAG: pirin-like C-terminal cupin domain-containing protein, partial [Nocardioidaceae bacterium]